MVAALSLLMVARLSIDLSVRLISQSVNWSRVLVLHRVLARSRGLVGAGHETVVDRRDELLLVPIRDPEHHHAVFDRRAVQVVERNVLRHGE